MQVALALAVIISIPAGVHYYRQAPLRHAFRYDAANQPENAIRWVDFYLQSHPDNLTALALKARILAAAPFPDAPQEAINIFDKYGPGTTEDFHAWAVACMRLDLWSRALPMLMMVVKDQPENAFALYELTTCRIRLGLMEEALDSATRYAALPGTKARGLLLQAVIHNDLRNREKSADLYGELLQLDPDAANLQLGPAEVLSQYGSILSSLGRYDESIVVLEKAVSKTPSALAFAHLGNAYNQVGNKEQAVLQWKRSLRYDPTNGDARESLATESLEAGDAEAGLQWLEGMETRPDLRSSTAYVFQQLYFLKGDKQAGETWRKKAEDLRHAEERTNIIREYLTTAPRTFWATVIRAHQYAAAQNWKQAEDLLNEIEAIDDSAPFVQELAKAVRERGTLPSLDSIPVTHF